MLLKPRPWICTFLINASVTKLIFSTLCSANMWISMQFPFGILISWILVLNAIFCSIEFAIACVYVITQILVLLQSDESIEASAKDFFEENYKELIKWVDAKSAKYGTLTVLRERRCGRPGTALKVCYAYQFPIICMCSHIIGYLLLVKTGKLCRIIFYQ